MKVYQLLLITLFSSLFISVSAQEQLSLSDAIKIGLERNYDIRIEEKTVEIAENNNSWGEAGKMPNVTLNATSNNSVVNNSSGDQFFSGATFPGFELNNQKNYSVTPFINVNWTIFNGNKVNINKARLENLQMESEGNAEIVIANAIQAIILGYYLAVLEKERLEVFERQLRLSSDKYEYIKTRSEIGSAVSSDLLLEEGNYLNDSVNYINQQLNYRDALRTLNFLLVETNIDKDYLLTDALVDEIENYEYTQLLEQIEKNNVDLKKQYISQAILRNNVGLARADRMPRLFVDFGYNWNRSVQDLRDAKYSGPNPDFTTPDQASVNKRGSYYVNFTLAFTLFNGNKINRAIKNTLIQEDIGNVRLEKLKASVYRDMADAYDEYSVRMRLYSINVRREQASETNLNISESKFDTGTINSFDYRTVQNNYLSASIQKLESLYNLVDSKVTLMRLTGGLIETYVEE